MDTVVLLSAFGITPARFPFVCLAVLMTVESIYIKVSIDKSLSKIKDNILVIVTYLTMSSKGKFNASLIKEMSPLALQPQGHKILEISGFTDLVIDSTNLAKFMSEIQTRKPNTKLDVENASIYAFLKLMSGDILLNPVRSYLYSHLDLRETFPTLAGIYLRDLYLLSHPEIKE